MNEGTTDEEDDLLQRSIKKGKRKAGEYSGTQSGPIVYDHEEIHPVSEEETEEEDDEIEEEGEEMEDEGQPQLPPRGSYRNALTGESSKRSSDLVTEEGGKNSVMENKKHEEQIFEDGVNWNDEEVVKGVICPVLRVTDEVRNKTGEPWRQTLVVHLLGRRIGFMALEKRLQQLWAKTGTVNLLDIGNDFYLVKFTVTTDMLLALTEGPWMIYDHYLIVREWEEDFELSKEKLEAVAVWVRLPQLPMEYYDSRILTRIGDRIGRTIKIDSTTTEMSRGKYARICVAVNLSKPLLSQFAIAKKNGNLRRIKIEYEGIHLICFNCGTYGHNAEFCPDKNVASNNGGAMAEAPTAKPAQEYGDWMTVQKQRRTRRSRGSNTGANGGNVGKQKGQKDTEDNRGSRFHSLRQLENLEGGEERDIREAEGDKGNSEVKFAFIEGKNYKERERFKGNGKNKTKGQSEKADGVDKMQDIEAANLEKGNHGAFNEGQITEKGNKERESQPCKADRRISTGRKEEEMKGQNVNNNEMDLGLPKPVQRANTSPTQINCGPREGEQMDIPPDIPQPSKPPDGLGRTENQNHKIVHNLEDVPQNMEVEESSDTRVDIVPETQWEGQNEMMDAESI